MDFKALHGRRFGRKAGSRGQFDAFGHCAGQFVAELVQLRRDVFEHLGRAENHHGHEARPVQKAVVLRRRVFRPHVFGRRDYAVFHLRRKRVQRVAGELEAVHDAHILVDFPYRRFDLEQLAAVDCRFNFHVRRFAAFGERAQTHQKLDDPSNRRHFRDYNAL